MRSTGNENIENIYNKISDVPYQIVSCWNRLTRSTLIANPEDRLSNK